MRIKIAFVQLLPGIDLDENLDIGKKACVEAKEKRQIWLREEPGSRDMCVLEAPGEPGVYVAELDLDRLRTHRSNDIMGDKYRHPEKYGILSNPDVRDVIGGEFVHW